MTESRCERARRWAALAPDSELAPLERRLLDAHLAHCDACRSFGEQVAALTEELRGAAAERCRRPLLVAAAPVRRSAYARVRSVTSIAAVAAMALGIAARAPLPAEDVRPQGPPGATPAAVDDAELHTMRLLRREALLGELSPATRPSGAFGNQPA